MNENLRNRPREKWYMTGFLPGMLYDAENRFVFLKGYLSKVSTYIESEAQSFRKGFETRLKSAGLTEIEAGGYYEAHAEQFEMWDSSFPNMIRKTVFVATCSLLEVSLTGTCKFLERDLGKQIQVHWDSINRDKGIRRAAKFLQGNLSMHLHRHPKWDSILDYYLVRDAIVHADGDLNLINKNKRGELDHVLRKVEPFGCLVDDSQIQTSDSFLSSVLKDIADFWKALEKAFIENSVVGPKNWP